MVRLVILIGLGIAAAACADPESPVTSPLADAEQPAAATVADVVGVELSGAAGGYTFSVTVSSPDTGCQQYADWWEVASESGDLVYRRVLLHSHVGEQPFTRSGGPIAIGAGEAVIVRAHMNNGGYGGQAFRGSADAGFEAFQPDAGFAAPLASRDPLPDGCDF